jgi:hypothetical protein
MLFDVPQHGARSPIRRLTQIIGIGLLSGWL